MQFQFSTRQHRLVASLLTVAILLGGVAPTLDTAVVGPAAATSTSEDWTAPTTVTTAVATDGAGHVYVNDDGGDTVNDGILRKYDPSGTQLWENTISDAPFNTLAASNSTLAVAASTSGFDAEAGSTYLKSLHPENGTVAWSKTGSDWGDVAVHDGTVVGLNRTGNTVEAFDADTGTQQWGYSFSGTTTGGEDTLAIDHQRGRVYLPISNGDIRGLYSTNGTLARSYTPTANVKRLLFDARNRRLYARYASTGSTLGVFNVTDTGINFQRNISLQGGTKGWAFDARSETFHHGTGNGGNPTMWSYNFSDIESPTHYDTRETGFTPHSLATHSFAGENTTVAVGTQSELQVYDSGQLAHALPTSDPTGETISGRVLTESGSPCQQCTVRVMAVNYSSLAVNPEQYQQRADELLARAQNTTPESWHPDIDLADSDGLFETTDEQYVAVHTEQDWNPGHFYSGDVVELREDPTLGQPLVHAPAGEELVVSIRTPTKSPFFQDDIDEDLPGVTTGGTVVFEQLGPDNSTLDRLEVETEPTVKTSAGKTHEVARVTLDRGFYRVHEESSSASYVLAVGDPEDIAAGYAADLRDRASKLSNHSQNLRDLQARNVFEPFTATTDANGRYSVAVENPNLERAALVAYRKPVGLDIDPQNVTLAEIREFYATTNTTTSVLLPTERTTAGVPEANVTVRVREFGAPAYLSPDRFTNLSDSLRDYFRNNTFSDLPTTLQQQLNNTSRERLEAVYQRLNSLADENDQLRDRYESVLNQRGETDIEVNVSGATDAELRERVQSLRQSITELRDTLDTGNVGVDVGENVASLRATFDAPLSLEEVTVLGHWSNGSSFVVNDSYVTLDKHAVSGTGFRTTTVHVEDYPVTSSDPATLRFEYRVATEDGLGSANSRVTNPTFDGEPPSLDSIDLSTLEPGPNETVEVDVNPREDSSFRRVTGATVFSPSGTEVATSNISGGDTFAFDTTSAGRYVVRVQMVTTEGASFVESFRLSASSTSRDRPASVRAMSGPTGTYALVGDGVEDGRVEQTDAGDTLELVAQLDAKADIPARAHVYLSSVQPGRTSDVTLRFVRGEDERALNRTVGVTVHSKRVGESAILYRDGRPITVSGTQFGQFVRQSDGTVVSTYTDDDGTITLQTVNAPTLWEQVKFQFQKYVPGFFAIVVSVLFVF